MPASEEVIDEKTFLEQWQSDVEGPARAAGLTPPKLLMHDAQYRRLDVPRLEEFEGDGFVGHDKNVIHRLPQYKRGRRC